MVSQDWLDSIWAKGSERHPVTQTHRPELKFHPWSPSPHAAYFLIADAENSIQRNRNPAQTEKRVDFLLVVLALLPWNCFCGLGNLSTQMVHGISGVSYRESSRSTRTAWRVEAPALDPAHYTWIQADGRGCCPCDSAKEGGAGGGSEEWMKNWWLFIRGGVCGKTRVIQEFKSIWASNSWKIILHWFSATCLSIIDDGLTKERLAQFRDQLYNTWFIENCT